MSALLYSYLCGRKAVEWLINMTEQIAVSVIMPVYNSERYLLDCVNSILSQNFNAFELLLIDDGSTDSSPQICDEIAQRDVRVKVYHKENGGICAARNFGLEHAVGEYIAFSDHDDEVNPGFFGENYFYAKRTNADIVKFGREALIIEDNLVTKKDIRVFPQKIVTRVEMRDAFLKLRFDGAMTCVWDGFFRREFLVQNKLQFNTAYKKGGEDIDFCSNCFAKAENVAFNHGVFYRHFIRIGFSTSTKPDDHRLEKFGMLIENLNDCAGALKIATESNPLFFLNVTKELVYPSLVYFKKLGTSFADVYVYLKKQCDSYRRRSPSIFQLMRFDLKWGLFAVLYKLGWYRVMYSLLGLNKE